MIKFKDAVGFRACKFCGHFPEVHKKSMWSPDGKSLRYTASCPYCKATMGATNIMCLRRSWNIMAKEPVSIKQKFFAQIRHIKSLFKGVGQ